MTQEEFNGLKQDIKVNGLNNPIITLEGKILDGRNRYKACNEAGVNPSFKEFDGDNPRKFVVSENLHRRHLTSDQRAALAVDALPAIEKEAKVKQVEALKIGNETKHEKHKEINVPSIVAILPQSTKDKKPAPKSRDIAAKEFSTSPRYVSDMKKIKEESPEDFEAIKNGDKKLTEVKKERKRVERIKNVVEISKGNETKHKKHKEINAPSIQVILPESRKENKPAPQSRDIAAKEFSTSPRYVSDMKKIKEESPADFEAIKNGEKKLTQSGLTTLLFCA